MGHCAGFTAARKKALVAELAPYASGERGSGEASRWSDGRDLEWVALRPELVAEVSYDHVSDGRNPPRGPLRALPRRPRAARLHGGPAGVVTDVAAWQAAQGLGAERARDAHGAVRAALAIQAQDTRSARLGVRARSEGLTTEDVVRACSQERSVVRTWAMRGTLHMLAVEDVRWITGLVGPVVEAKDARRRLGLGLDPGLSERILAEIPADPRRLRARWCAPS